MSKILIVDDDPDLAAICSLVLETEGYDIGVATNGVDAYDMLTTQEVDAVLLDIMMPALDGLTVCKMVKRDPKTRDLPVIVMSASEGLREGARNAEADAVLEKPFNIDMLIDTVGRFASAAH